MKHLFLIMTGFLIISSSLIGQNKVSGQITDEFGEPFPGVSVLEKNTTKGFVSDFNGKYEITVEDNATLVFRYLGYKTEEILVNGRNNISLKMVVDNEGLDEIVVVAYGTQKKETITGSIETLKVGDVVNSPVTNVKNLLIGQIPGLLTNQNPGLPGSDNVALSIRGFGAPLIIVDGVESFFDRIDPNDIESITVLKDASAAIYGARAGNGVILVTTKRGKAGKTSIDYHGYYGFQKEISFANYANATDYLTLGRSAIFNDQYDPANPDADVVYPADFSQERLDLYTSGQRKSYDWADGLLKNSGAAIAQHNLSIRGGGEKFKYFTSIGLATQDAIFEGDYDYRKLTITNNMDADLSENLKMSLNTSFIDEYKDYAATTLGDFFGDLRTAQPFYNYEFPDADRAPFSGFTQRSPVARVNQRFSGYNRTRTETLAAALELKYKTPFIDGLSIGVRVNARFRNDYQDFLRRAYDIFSYDPEAVTEDNDGYTLEASNFAQAGYDQAYFTGAGEPRRRILPRFFIEYDKSLGNHDLKFLALKEKETNTFNNLFVQRRELLSFEVPQISGADDLTSIGAASTGRTQEYKRVSYAARANYSYKDKYLLEATIRADGSSYFGPDVRWGYFPSVSLGWNISKENFLKDNEFVRNLKLRLSYSETGVDSNVGRTTFDYLTGFSESLGNVYFLDNTATPIIVDQGLANPFITWEQTKLYNAGLDFSFLNGQLYGSVDVFYRLREGLLRRPIQGFPSTFGANLPLTNLDSRSNRGFDLSLGYKGRVGEDFTFTLNGNVGLAREKFEKVEEEIDETNPIDVKYNKREGRFVNETVFGYVSDGLFQNQLEVDDYLNQYTLEDLNGSPQLGDIRYKDVNGDNIINQEDREQLGFGTFPEMTFALTTNFKYKNFGLNLLWQGATRFNLSIATQARNPFDNERVPLQIHTQYSFYQDPENPGQNGNPNAQLPAFGRNGARAWNNNFSDFWYKDATYLRLKTASINYSIPKNILEKTGMNKCELYVSADNLLMFNKLGIFSDIIDPEAAANNDGFTLPTLRTVTLGIKIGL
ncbi:SusC/RagA family TonB-linked outer membrane protein [Polaribacter sp. L3A8]|uniref:SusC/RagA family TonB-linked outer membrane protein n=1 Tax=Polaribacter sp. L3A8 TaxID=2686361 RepID=UPI00131CB87D|nr:TonB-dependent receptor [Polaribacter sp. L3A8]